MSINLNILAPGIALQQNGRPLANPLQLIPISNLPKLPQLIIKLNLISR